MRKARYKTKSNLINDIQPEDSSRTRNSNEFNPDQIKLSVKKIKKLKKSGVIGGVFTHLALKNSSSFLIGTDDKGLEVYENNQLICSMSLPEEDGTIFDMIYVEGLDFYLLNLNRKLYRKDISTDPLSRFMDLDCGKRISGSLKYSKINQRLIINTDSANLFVVNPRKRRIELNFQKESGDGINDLRLFGKDENRIVAITKDGYILLLILNFRFRKVFAFNAQKLNFLKKRKEIGVSITVCDRNKHFLVEIRGNKDRSLLCSRVAIFELKVNTVVLKDVVDHYEERIGRKFALEFYGYYGGHILWVGLSVGRFGVAQIYDFDINGGKLKELEERGVEHQEKWPLKLSRFGNDFYYSGDHGKLMRLSISV